MFEIGVTYLDYYVNSVDKNKCNNDIRLYCKDEGFNLEYFTNLINLVLKK
ncbi:hypothetical protein [uncultured Clostridium sp.]|nr:hypothetical protein [uncultured Clostridium sp.]